MSASKEPVTRPPSATNGWISLVGALSGILTLLVLINHGGVPTTAAMILCGLAITLPIMVGDFFILRVHRRASTGLGIRQAGPWNWARISTKLVGLLATYGTIAFFYWLLPEYHKDFFDPFYHLAGQILPWIVLFSVPYFALVDQRMKKPRDAYWHLGRIVLGHWAVTSETRRKLKEHALGWAIKAFFVPLMTVFFYKNIGWMMAHPPVESLSQFRTAVFWFISLGFFLDVAFAFIGYVLTMRLFDSHIRSSNPLLLGWGVALVCYPPFWTLIGDNYLAYKNSPDWFAWLQPYPTLLMIWGSVLIGLVMIYALATVIFGIRFSNLTHRGIITGGPYRFTKHPAYVAKNLYWWLATVPFIAEAGWQVALASCLMLLGVNVIYFLRARTEERHLASDPAYVAYALWINENGLFRNISRIVPLLRFKAPLPAPESSDSKPFAI